MDDDKLKYEVDLKFENDLKNKKVCPLWVVNTLINITLQNFFLILILP